jgi:hypothetical protein
MKNACNILLSEVQVQSESTKIAAISEMSIQNNETTIVTPSNNGSNVLIENLDEKQVSLESVFS